jgi:SPP1 family predicted phage head-tail adaptor
MNPAEYNRRITFQVNNPIVDEEGNRDDNWQPVLTVWAAVEPVSTRWREFFAAAAVQAESYVRFRIRYRSDITPEMQVVYAGQPHNIIVAEDPDGKRREMHVMARKVVPGG